MRDRTAKQVAADEACKVAFAHYLAASKVLARAKANLDKSIERLTNAVAAADAAADVAWSEYEAALKAWTETR